MNRHLSSWIGLAAVAAWITAVPALAQDRAGAAPPSSGGGGGGGSATAASSGGGSSSNGGGSTTSSGSGGAVERAGAGWGGGARGEAGGHGGATGGSGIAVPRNDHTVGRYTEGSSRGSSTRNGDDNERGGVPQFSRPRDGAPTTGTAVARPAGSIPPGHGTSIVVVPGGYYGYGYPYYGGYYGYGYGGAYGAYGAYYDPFYDPWYGGYYSTSSYADSQGTTGTTYSSSFSSDEGALRLKIKPRDAEVYVDGYYVGKVDEFDGMFQRLHIEPGVHRVEVRAGGYEALTFEVKISP